ncbi:hypothetical protein KBTX_00754 [wastewater metagenome]|uniref:Thioesterase superfamily n=3 Tax=root TaxID=1 RepID=A0A5B8R6X1_9ZZZZ|nr:thioesterase family protein [Arhodomonas aquaeolei]MCS4503568.1 acyl-CoA thioesterase [Arhodomonas aquaeolei]QEA04446.1 hypothetical protein KBTEX_00754 [uncultured organism]
MNQNTDTTLLAEAEIPVRWGDMDALGHVNNTIYFRYFEQVRIEWLQQIGVGESVGGGTALGPVVVNAFCEFRRAIVYPATLNVRMFGDTPRRSSFDTRYEIRDAGDGGVVYATGSARVVWVDHHAGRAVAVPANVRALLPAS